MQLEKHRMSESVHDDMSSDSKNSWKNNQDANFRTNISTPISKLPVELLCRIFHINRPYGSVGILGGSGMSNQEYFYSKLGWVAVTWVCRSWRSIALNDSTLWSDLPLTFPKWTTVMLERSQNTGFTVDLHSFSCSSRGREIVLPAIIANASRVAELMLVSEGTNDMLKLLAHFLSTPKLSILRLSTPLCDPLPHIDLPKNIFHNIVRLRSLELDSINIDWDSHLFSNPLHTLVLTGVSNSARPTIAKLRSICKYLSPTLKVLRLRRALPILSSANQNTDQASLGSSPISLPLLEHIELHAGPGQLLSFFNNFSPGDHINNVQIITAFEISTRPAFISFMDALYRHHPLAQFLSTVPNLALSSLFGGLDFSLYNLDRSTCRSPSDSGTSPNTLINNFRLYVSLQSMRGSHEAEMASAVIEDVFHALHWTNLCKLQINLGWGDEASPHLDSVLRSTFGTLTTLQSVRLVGVMSTRHVLEILQMDPGATSANTTSASAIPFPGLKEIIIQDSIFGVSGLHTAKVNQLRRAVEGRLRLGIPIVKISLIGSKGLDEKGVESLRRYVDNVTWDRYEETEYETDDSDGTDHDDDSEEEDEENEDEEE